MQHSDRKEDFDFWFFATFFFLLQNDIYRKSAVINRFVNKSVGRFYVWVVCGDLI